VNKIKFTRKKIVAFAATPFVRKAGTNRLDPETLLIFIAVQLLASTEFLMVSEATPSLTSSVRAKNGWCRIIFSATKKSSA
jgi:hypothetical protein